MCHRANAAEVYSGPDAIEGHFEQPIGGEWNVKFVRLKSEEQITGNDGRVVERGDLAIAAGADDRACHAGSYMATWAPRGRRRLEAAGPVLAGRRDRARELQAAAPATRCGRDCDRAHRRGRTSMLAWGPDSAGSSP